MRLKSAQQRPLSAAKDSRPEMHWVQSQRETSAPATQFWSAVASSTQMFHEMQPTWLVIGAQTPRHVGSQRFSILEGAAKAVAAKRAARMVVEDCILTIELV